MARKEHSDGSNRPLILRAAVAILIAWPHPAQASAYCIAHDNSHYMQATLNGRVKAVVDEGEKYLQSPSINIIRLLNASTNWQERGQMNYGIFEITSLQNEPVVLKIVNGDQFWVRNPENGLLMDFTGELQTHDGLNVSSAAFKQYIDVHSLLGQLFVAPRLIAVLSGRSLKEAFELKWKAMKEVADQFEFSSNWLKKPRFHGGQAVGIVMQRLPLEPEQGPIHPISRPTKPHAFMAEWSPSDVLRAIYDMIEIRRRVITAGVNALDQQFVVTPSARAYLIDLDQARFNPHDPSFDISYEMLKLIDQWEAISGQRLSRELRFELLDKASVPYAVCSSDADFKDMLHDWRCEDLL